MEGGAEALLTKPIDFVVLRGEIDNRVAIAGQWTSTDSSRCPSWVNRYRSLAVEPDAKSAVARKLT